MLFFGEGSGGKKATGGNGPKNTGHSMNGGHTNGHQGSQQDDFFARPGGRVEDPSAQPPIRPGTIAAGWHERTKGKGVAPTNFPRPPSGRLTMEDAIKGFLAEKMPGKDYNTSKVELVVKIPERGVYELHVGEDISLENMNNQLFNSTPTAKELRKPNSSCGYDSWLISADTMSKFLKIDKDKLRTTSTEKIRLELNLAQSGGMQLGAKSGMEDVAVMPMPQEGDVIKAVDDIKHGKPLQKTEQSNTGLENIGITTMYEGQTRAEKTDIPAYYLITGIQPGTPRSRVFSEELRASVQVPVSGGSPHIIRVPAKALELRVAEWMDRTQGIEIKDASPEFELELQQYKAKLAREGGSSGGRGQLHR